MPPVRHLGLIAATFLLIAAAIGLGPAQTPAEDVAGAQLAAPTAVTVSGLDLHDGQIVKVGSTYYLYGTEYGCGFTWMQSPTPWCGFGVSTASSLSGPWSAPQLLFPASAPDPYSPGKTYQATCGSTGQGCFSPRMVQRTGWGANDGVWVLWFNAPWYYSNGGAQHAYMAMGCNSPSGPCGATAGAPYGTTYRPVLHQCVGANGDAGLSASSDGTSIYLLCPMAGTTSVAVERLDKWGTNGTGTGTTNVAGLSSVEAMGMWRDTGGTWVMTYSDVRCGYCAGTGTGYATASSPLGPWTAPGNVGVGAPANARRLISADSCGGQPDTVSLIDGQAFEKVNLWTGQMNETSAGLHFEPLTYAPALAAGNPGDGGLHRVPFSPFACN